jgi:hypothetical protein
MVPSKETKSIQLQQHFVVFITASTNHQEPERKRNTPKKGTPKSRHPNKKTEPNSWG